VRNQPLFSFLILCTLFVVVFANPGHAQAPSLAPADAYYVTADTEFGKETFTILRDGRLEEQFYFVPARPHIAMETRNGKQYPVFTLLTFQRTQPDNQPPLQGGIMQLSIQSGISEKTQKSLLATIKSKFPLSDSTKSHRLSPVPMKEAHISMYDLDGKMLSSAPVQGGVAPLFGNQQYPFMLNLTDIGADVMTALCEGKGGLPVIITYTFQGMTPPGGFKVEVNWDMCYKHLSTDTKLRARVAYAKLGANLGADMSTIRDEMISNGMMKITALTNEALSDSALDAAMTPVISLITSELFENIKAPPQITPAAAAEIAPPDGVKEPAESGVVASATEVAKANGLAAASTEPAAGAAGADAAAGAAGAADAAQGAAAAAGQAASAAATAVPYVGTIMKVLDVAADIAKNTKIDIGASFAMKKAELVKKGTFTYTYDRQAIVDRQTSFGGPIGIGNFDDRVKAACKMVLPEGRWETAYYVLPTVGDPSALGFKQMNISVQPVCDGKPIPGMQVLSAFFREKDGFWSDKNGRETRNFLFMLKALNDSAEFKANPDKFKFKTTLEVIPVTGNPVKVVSETPIFNGDLAMISPSELLQPVILSGDCLSFGDADNEIRLANGVLEASDYIGPDGKKTFSFPFKLDANTPVRAFLIPQSAGSVKITGLQFISKKGAKVPWVNNRKNLRDLYPDLDVMFFDRDWQKTADADAIGSVPEPESAR